MPEAHAINSPSSAHRWMTCPGSQVLSAGIPNKSSAHADEGTRAHEFAEHWITNRKPDPDMPAEWHEPLGIYVNHVLETWQDGGEVLMVEKRIKATDTVWGTADALVWQPDTKTLHVIDLKFGAGVAVEVSGNVQLKIYALGALRTFGFPAKTVVATIVQPRLPHADGPVRSKEFSADDLLEFYGELKDAVKRVEAAFVLAPPYTDMAVSQEWSDTFLDPSEKACRWCLAAGTCPKVAKVCTEIATKVFAPTVSYDPQELADVLHKLPLFESWIKNVREFAYGEAEAGRAIPGWKIVEKRATRKWKDEGAAFDALTDLLPACDLREEPKLKTPAAVEKLLDRSDRSILDTLTTKESSGHTLVPETDKRESVRLDAKSAFTK